MSENYTVRKSIKDIQKPFDDFNQSRYVATEIDFYQIYDGFRSKFEQYVQKLFTKNPLTAR